MKKLSKIILHATVLSLAFVAACPTALEGAVNKTDQALKIRIVNFKSCVEKSKLGKQEQSSFEALKKQMETMLGEKEKTLTEMSEKFNDPDYLDSLSVEAETELKRKSRALYQELNELNQQYYQALQQANFKIMDKLSDSINKAAEIVAKKNGIDVVLNEDGTYYYDKDLDISDEVVKTMDELYEKESKDATMNKDSKDTKTTGINK